MIKIFYEIIRETLNVIDTFSSLTFKWFLYELPCYTTTGINKFLYKLHNSDQLNKVTE